MSSIAFLSNSSPRLRINDRSLIFSATGSPCWPSTVFVLVLMRAYSPLSNITCIGSCCFEAWSETSTFFRCWYCFIYFGTLGCQTSFINFRSSDNHQSIDWITVSWDSILVIWVSTSMSVRWFFVSLGFFFNWSMSYPRLKSFQRLDLWAHDRLFLLRSPQGKCRRHFYRLSTAYLPFRFDHVIFTYRSEVTFLVVWTGHFACWDIRIHY